MCERGSVKLDDWSVSALAYQHSLQRSDPLVYYQMPGTHNSAINEADGFGIEKYFMSALFGGQNFDQGDDVGEGLCQYLSVTDQLRMGVRHVEIDVWWGPVEKDIVVCHSPIPLYPVGNVSRTAEALGLDLEWHPAKMSCMGTKRMFRDVLGEVQAWLAAPGNEQEVLVLYIDTKFYLSPEQVTLANNEILSVFGEAVWRASEGSPLNVRVGDMLAKGKRVIVENQKECWVHPSEGDQVVFYPALWTHQFSAESLVEYPGCSVEGDAAWYGSQFVRALDGS
ncbi:hypothetical protein EON64_16655, partial [archaeon]